MKRIVYFTTKYTALLLAGIISISYMTVTVHAVTEKEKETFKKEIILASELLQKAIENSRIKTYEQLKKNISKTDLDYQLTMMSYDNQEDPYSACNYNELIFAYAVAKENSDAIDTLYNLPFYTVSYKETTVEEFVPKLVQTYDQTEDGYYTLGKKVYIEKPTEIVITKKVSGVGNKYQSIGTKTVSPELKKLNYGEVSVKGLSAEDILSYFGVNNDTSVLNEYEKKLAKAESIVSGTGLSEIYNIAFPAKFEISEDIKAYISNILLDEKIDYTRRSFISVAQALIGKVPYEWGGKSEKSGYDTTWWTLKDNGQQKGLDCSGFVQWAFRTARFEGWKELVSTKRILGLTKTISSAELQPGDLGLLNNGQSLNHVGIYAGEGYWIHCSSGKGTVVIEKTDMFTIFKEMPKTGTSTKNEEVLEHSIYQVESPEDEEKEYTKEDVYLLAQLINHEAHTEGLNGWIAVGEVVKNRLHSKHFPSTLREVIYQKGQFAYSDEIENMVPTEEEIEVAENVLHGRLEILGNDDVLFFRNANGSKEAWGDYRWFAEINHHEFYLGRT